MSLRLPVDDGASTAQHEKEELGFPERSWFAEWLGSDVFISYSHLDKAYAASLATQLSSTGLRVFLDTSGLTAGQQLSHRLQKEIRRANVVVVLVSRTSKGSAWVLKEIRFAIARRINIIPIALSPDLQVTEEREKCFEGALDDLLWLFETQEPAPGLPECSTDIVAGIIGAKKFVRKETRGRRILQIAFAGLLALLAVAVVQAVRATRSEAAARAARQLAEAQTAAARTSESAAKAAQLAEQQARLRAEEAEGAAERQKVVAEKAASSEADARRLAQARERDAVDNLSRVFVEQAITAALRKDSLAAAAAAREALTATSDEETRSLLGALLDSLLPPARNEARARFAELLMRRRGGEASEHLGSASFSQRLGMASELKKALGYWVDTMVDAGNQPAYESILKYKGAVARQAVRDRQRQRRLTPELSTERDRAVTAVSQVAYGDSKEKVTELRNAVSRLETTTKRMAQRTRRPEGAVAFGEKDLHAALGDGEVVVDFFRSERRYSAWVVAKGVPTKYVALGPADEIDAAVKHFREFLWKGAPANAPIGSADAGTRGISISKDQSEHDFSSLESTILRHRSEGPLRDLAWTKVESLLPPNTQVVYLVPDASLATVAWPALKGRSPGKVLVDEYTFAYLSSAADIAEPEEPCQSEGALVVGDVRPTFGGAASHLTEIPGTGLEAAAVEAALHQLGVGGDVVLLHGATASESAVRRRASRKRVIHIASHAWSDFPLKLPDALVRTELRPIDTLSAEFATAQTLWDPSFRAAALLGGDLTNDGVLTAAEASGLSLDGAALVVLSSCNSGGEAISGEGLLGLLHGFKEAGAGTVVVSVDVVPDEPTAAFMRAFYAKLGTTRSVPKALRAAELEQKKENPNPMHWAMFAPYGRVESACGPKKD